MTKLKRNTLRADHNKSKFDVSTYTVLTLSVKKYTLFCRETCSFSLHYVQRRKLLRLQNLQG